MDERIKGEYQRIYSELTSILTVFAAAMLLIKFFLLGKTPGDCVTEMGILIGAPVYLAVRQYMLGLDPEAVMPAGRRRKRAVIAAAAGALGFILAASAKRGVFGRWAFAYIVTFLAAFSLIYCVSGRLAKYFSEKKSRKYDDLS